MKAIAVTNDKVLRRADTIPAWADANRPDGLIEALDPIDGSLCYRFAELGCGWFSTPELALRHKDKPVMC